MATARCSSALRLSLHSRKAAGSSSCPARTLTRETVSVRAMLDRGLGELLQRALHVGHEPVGVGAVHDPVIEREREHSLRPDSQAVGPVNADHGWLLLDRADTED